MRQNWHYLTFKQNLQATYLYVIVEFAICGVKSELNICMICKRGADAESKKWDPVHLCCVADMSTAEVGLDPGDCSRLRQDYASLCGCFLSKNMGNLQRYMTRPLEVAGVTFSDSDSAPVPKFLNPDPGPAIFQILKSDSRCNHRSSRNLPMFFLKKWPFRLLLLLKLKSDPDPGLAFPKFLTPGPHPGAKEKRRILPELTPDPVPPLVNYCWIEECSPSLNRSRILKFEKLPDQDPEPDSKLLEQERSRSLKKWLRPPQEDWTGSGLWRILLILDWTRTLNASLI